jgi:hypothetical protein
MTVATIAIAIGAAVAAAPQPPPVDAQFDYQLGGDYAPPAGVTVVSRDWFAGEPLDEPGGYSICYVNAFQTQPDEPDVVRPDERSQWPSELVLSDLGDDPNWEGEYLVDVSTARTRAAAAEHVAPMIDACAVKGFQAVELDNLDSWTRLEVPFGQAEAVAYAELLADHAHAAGLAVGQKNTPGLGAEISREVIGFDFAVAEECGVYDECAAYIDVFGSDVIDVEYTAEGFAAACDVVGDRVSVVLRDVAVSTPDAQSYVYDSC